MTYRQPRDKYEDVLQTQLLSIANTAMRYDESAELLAEAGHPDAPFYVSVAEAHRSMATDLAVLLGIVQ